MEPKSFANKESFKLLLFQSLKSQLRTQFGDAISRDLESHCTNHKASNPEAIVNEISDDISQSKDFSELMSTFMNDVGNLLLDETNHQKAHSSTSVSYNNEIMGLDSLNSSASSLNTSIDFLSSDQFQKLAQKLLNGSSLEKLEALETFCRLPTLEHILKPALWLSVESGLYNALSSNISFLRESALKLYAKMLSSSEPKVVQESYSSLLKYLLNNLELLFGEAKSGSKFLYQVAVEITVTFIKFLQNIPLHWLRYPQVVIEDITVHSIDILIVASQNSTLPIWTCIALCDPEARWIRNIMNGHISRTAFLLALKQNISVLKFAIEFCQGFFTGNEYLSVTQDNCCENISTISKITHFVCFVSHLLQYKDSRCVFDNAALDLSITSWINGLDLVMKCAWKLCDISCFKCAKAVFDTVSQKWKFFGFTNDVSQLYNIIHNILISCFTELKSTSQEMNCICFIIECMCQAFDDFSAMSHVSKLTINEENAICILLRYCTERVDYSDVSMISSVNAKLLFSSLSLVKKLFFSPNVLLIDTQFIQVVIEWWLKVNHVSLPMIKSLMRDRELGTISSDLIFQIEEKTTEMHIFFLSKPLSITISHRAKLFEASLNVLLEKMHFDTTSKNYICPSHISILSIALNYDLNLKSVINKLNVFKLSSVIWHGTQGCDYIENLETMKCMLVVLIPCIFADLVQTEMLPDFSSSATECLWEYVLLFPDVAKCEYFSSEDSKVIALQVISVLTNSIQMCCTLQSKFKISDLFLDSQCNQIAVGKNCVVDELTLLRNLILVKLYAIGGLNEKVLPPETLFKCDETYDWPIVKAYPLQDIYYKVLQWAEEDDSEMFDEEEIDKLNILETYINHTKSSKNLNPNFVMFLLNNRVKDTSGSSWFSKPLNPIKLGENSNIILCDEIRNGISMAVRYGTILSLLTEDSVKDLQQLTAACKCLLETESNKMFDVFLSTIFMIFKGDSEASWIFLENFAESRESIYIWYERLTCSGENKYAYCYGAIMEYCDLIIKETLPLIFSAFQFSSILPSLMFKYWTVICYWNYLNWNEICHFVILSILFSGDYAIYFFVSILKHLKDVILKHAHSHDILYMLQKDPIVGYTVADYIDFISELSNKYHNDITKKIESILQ